MVTCAALWRKCGPVAGISVHMDEALLLTTEGGDIALEKCSVLRVR